MIQARWEDGRLLLPTGVALEVEARGHGAAVRWLDEAFELSRPMKTAGAEDDTIELVIKHGLHRPEHLFIPHLAPEPGNVIGDAVFRSPAILIADRALAIAFIPDLDDVCRADGFRAWLDYDHPRSTMTFAVGAYEETGHVFFKRKPAHFPKRDVSLRIHVLTSSEPRDLENPYGMAARWLWEHWGQGGFERASAPPIDRYAEHVLHWAFSSDGWGESVWQDVAMPDGSRAGAPVFIVDVNHHPSVPLEKRTWREPPSIWNQAWFSTQRCANGLLRHARRTGSLDLEKRAHSMTQIALGAPQSDGLFPAVLLRDGTGEETDWRWTNSNRRPPSASESACHIVDAAFTSRMLLDWYALTSETVARDYVLAFAERLVSLQRATGAFPGWVEPDGRVVPELAEGPESAVAVTLLLELAKLADVPDARRAAYRRAALAALSFLENVARHGRWEDFETYYSCAPWGADDQIGRRVLRNGVYKQNTLSIFWCAEAFVHAWRATGDARHLDLARRAVDELSLYQAVTDVPFYPAPTHGGFGVMNGDCEWNDARQSLFAPLYLELGRETKDTELVQRGVSALRASFTMLYCPENAALAKAYEARFPFFGPESYGFMMENQGHNPSEPIGTFTIFTWGNGSALATLATVRDRFPEIAREYGFE